VKPEPEPQTSLVLDAITLAINNHMKPTTTVTNGKRRQIDRPYGESLTSVDAYMKIQQKENARKGKRKKETNENEPKPKAPRK
jgi:hypothetical protein